MDTLIPLLTALWLGILCAISPCPLTTNLAAMSFIALRIAHKRVVVLSGLLYTLGRATAYIAVSFLIVRVMVNTPLLSDFLQRYMNKAMGILLIAVGVFLLGRIKLNIPSLTPSLGLQRRLGSGSLTGAFALGAIFALAFCPVSAALFFGSLIPMAFQAKSDIALPLIFGVGTAAPVLCFAILIALGSQYLTKVYEGVSRIEGPARKITGSIFMAIGVYYVLSYNLEVL
jgi:cytochrome c-type biogenesis protein